MRFIHIADTHLGMKPDRGYPWSEAREDELWFALERVCKVCREEGIPLLLIAGDLFHSQPKLSELKEVNGLFASVPGTRVVIIAGNHDYIGAASGYRDFEWVDNVSFFPAENVASVYFEELNTEIYGLSFRHRQIREPLLKGIKPQHADRINILLMHGGIQDCLPTDFKELEAAGFDYVACGHIHTPQKLAKNIIYPGCLEPLEKNDTGERGYIKADIDGQTRAADIRFVPDACRKYFKTDINVTPDMTAHDVSDRIADIVEECGKENIYSFTLKGRRDADICFDSVAARDGAQILEIEDLTEPDYDFDRLLKENRDNIIGMYINRICAGTGNSETKRKALTYGISALLGKLE